MASAASRWGATLLALSSLLIATISPAASRTTDLRIASSDDSGLLIELATPFPRIEKEHAADGTAYHRVRVPGWGSTNVPGQPELPVRSVLIQVPAAGAVEVEVEEDDVRTRSGLTVAPVLPASRQEDEEGAARLLRDEIVYSSAQFQPEGLYDLSPRAILRGVPVMRLTLHPIRWNPASGELRHVGTMTVRVRFGEPLPDVVSVAAGQPDPLSPVWEGSIANWRGPRASAAVTPGSVAAILPAGRFGVRMEVKQPGVYRVTGRDLIAAGVAIGAIDPRTFRVYSGGREVAVRVVSRYGTRLAAQDLVEFYARSLENSFTDTNVYWLFWGGRRGGARIGTVDGRATAGSPLVGSFPERLHFEENHKFWEMTPGAPRLDYWFWDRLQGPQTVTHTLTIPSPAASTAPANLRVSFQGRTTGTHHVRVFLNGLNQVGDDQWTGTGEHLLQMPFDQGLLRAGANDITIELPGDVGLDQLYVNWIEVDYERRTEAVSDTLRLTVPGAAVRRSIQVSGFTRPSVRVVDVTDPARPFFLTGASVAWTGRNYRIRFGIGPGGTRSLLVFAASTVRTPVPMARWNNPNLNPADGADYILITPREFLAAATPLLALRRNQGLRVQAVAVEDVFDVYGGGVPDPAAVKAFLKDAYLSWKRPAPAHVLLLGDANVDYRDFLGTGKKSLVPAHFSPTMAMNVTPDDNWFAAVDGDDDLPDLFIGRISVSSVSAVAAAVAKIVGYESAPAPGSAEALFVADNNDPLFQSVAEGLAALVPETVTAHRLYLSTYTDFGRAKQDLRSAIDGGKLLTMYVGHGDVTGWAGERLLDTTTAQLLGNSDRLTFVVALDCLNGYFAPPSSYSIGELLTNMPGKGAIATFAASGFGDTGDHRLLGEELLARSFTEPRLRLGRITTEAKVQAYARGATLDLVKTFTLLGDPATILASPW